MDKELLNEINAFYCRLETRHDEIANALFHRIFQLESHWYSGHYHKDDNGNWITESYPIPVISVKGFCDVEIRFDKISVLTKLQRHTALSYSFEKFDKYEFEAYGVDNYFVNFHCTGQTVQEMKNNIRTCREKEINFSIIFPFDVDGKELFEFVKLLRREGFYY